MALGRLERNSGKDAAAQARFEEAIRSLDSTPFENPDSIDRLADLASVYDALGMVLGTTGEATKGLEYLDLALQTQRLLLERRPDMVCDRTALAALHNHLGFLQSGMGFDEPASTNYKEAIRIEEAAEREQATVAPADRARLASYYFNTGNHTRGNHFDSERTFYYERCRKILEELVHENPSVNQFRAELVRVYGAIAVHQRVCNRFNEALKGFVNVRELLEALSREHPDIVRHRQDLAVTIANIAELHVREGNAEKAIALYAESSFLLNILVAKNPKHAPWYALLGEIGEQTGRALESLGRNEEAVAAYRNAIDCQDSADKLGPPTRPYLGTVLRHLHVLANLERSRGRTDEAVAVARRYRAYCSHDPRGTFRAAVEFAQCIPQAQCAQGNRCARQNSPRRNAPISQLRL